MKFLKILFFVSLGLCNITLYGMAGGFPGGPGDAMFQMPSPEEMKMIEEFLNTLSPEELDQLAKIGEDIIKQAEAEGRPLFPDMPPPVAQPKPVEKKAPEKEPVSFSSTTEILQDTQRKDAENVYHVVQTLVHILEDLRKKSEIDERYSMLLMTVHNDLDLFIYYLRVIQDKKYLSNLLNEEFDTFKKDLIHLKHTLESPVRHLTIPPLVTTKVLSRQERQQRRAAIELAEKTIVECATVLQNIFKKEIIKECEKLVKKYEPQALKIKEELGKQTQLAYTQASKTPITNTGKMAPIPTYSVKSSHVAAPQRASSVGVTIPSSYDHDKRFEDTSFSSKSKSSAKSTPKQQAKKAGAAAGSSPAPSGSGSTSDNKGNDTGKNAADETEKQREAIKKNQNALATHLKNANNEARKMSGFLNNFFDSYIRTPDRNSSVEDATNDALYNINHYLKQAQTNYNEIIKASDKLSPVDARSARKESQKQTDTQSKQLTDLYEKLQKLKESDEWVDEKYEAVAQELDKFDSYMQKLPFDNEHVTRKNKISKWQKKKGTKRSPQEEIVATPKNESATNTKAPRTSLVDELEALPILNSTEDQ